MKKSHSHNHFRKRNNNNIIINNHNINMIILNKIIINHRITQIIMNHKITTTNNKITNNHKILTINIKIINNNLWRINLDILHKCHHLPIIPNLVIIHIIILNLLLIHHITGIHLKMYQMVDSIIMHISIIIIKNHQQQPVVNESIIWILFFANDTTSQLSSTESTSKCLK